MLKSIFSLSWQAKTAKKCFASPDGDHLTLINVYRAADELLQKRRMELGIEKNEKNIKGKNEKILRKWCRENFINSRSLRHACDIHRLFTPFSSSFPLGYFTFWQNSLINFNFNMDSMFKKFVRLDLL
jgi:hypothetical protein